MKNNEATLSSFRFKLPRVTSWQFAVNENFSLDSYSNTEINYTSHIVKSNEEDKATVTLDLKIGDESNKNPFYIHAKIMSEFIWEKDFSEENVNKLLNENSIALLISYLRPMISQFTTYAGFMPFQLPYLDVRQLKTYFKDPNKAEHN